MLILREMYQEILEAKKVQGTNTFAHKHVLCLYQYIKSYE